MEIISKISKGSKMDQIYIPKNRDGFPIRSYVVIKQIEAFLEEKTKKIIERPFFYNIKYIEPIKLLVIKKILEIVEKAAENENIIITGSFLDKGFNFKDIDIMIISKHKIDTKYIKNNIEKDVGIIAHIIVLNNKTLLNGLSTDPLYQMMLSRYVSKKRFVYKTEKKINYKILDLHLLKSKLLIENFDVLNGNEKYYFIRNMIAILLFLENKKINIKNMEKEIKQMFDINSEKIKQNLLEKNSFLKHYKKVHNKIFNKIMKGIKNGSKQE